jgi:hypothetical protein
VGTTVLSGDYCLEGKRSIKSLVIPKNGITHNKGKEREKSYRKLKRSPEERHTQTHRNFI